jgi:hypothetical protein
VIKSKKYEENNGGIEKVVYSNKIRGYHFFNGHRIAEDLKTTVI